jgi:molybdopterin molybdotransferase
MAGELIEIGEARERVLARCVVRAGETVPLESALGRTLLESVAAAERVPGFDNSAMDGYAVRAADLAGASEGGIELRVVGESRAGSPGERKLGPGEATAISTGAMIPPGADTVVRVEDTSRVRTGGGEVVEVRAAPEPGANVRRAGEDVEPDDELVGAGTTLGAAELGVLASVGVAEARCARRPRFALLCTGDELVGVEDPLPPGGVRNSNAYSLPALARASGAEIVGVARATDDHDATVEAIEAGLGADALVVSGGVSVGEHDHVRPALAELGVDQHFWGVSLKPGKPAYFGTRGESLAFGLPGNPVSAYVTFLLFVRPALLALQGADPGAVRGRARLSEAYEKPTDRAHAIRCRLEVGDEGWIAHPAPQQGSHVMTSLLGADALALIDADAERVEAGEVVTVELL